MSLCCVYGLWVHSNLPIPGLIPCGPSPRMDLEVSLGFMPDSHHEMLEPGESCYESSYVDERGQPSLVVWKLADDAYYRLRYSDRTEFLIDRSGTRLWVSWPQELTIEDAATYLLGPVMGFVLLLRGIHSLHGSAIAVGDKAVALVGPPGAGKSTTAAAFAELGFNVLAEDVVALADQRDAFLVYPAYPRIRLWPDSVTSLYGSPDALPRLTPTWDKRYLDLKSNWHRFQPEPLRLAAVYILGARSSDSSAPSIAPLPPSAGLMALVANMYATKFMDRAMRAREFELLGRITSRVPLRQLTPHADPAHLSKLCDAILDDFRLFADSSFN